jgi:CheY-like chemotaxis protein
VLIVEDDIGQRQDYRELLEEAGYAVNDAGDGRKALRRLADENEPLPALIVLDLSMPFMDGWDFIAILQTNQRLAGIPVVLTSAYDADASVQSSVAAYIRKPVDPRQFVATVTSLLDKR